MEDDMARYGLPFNDCRFEIGRESSKLKFSNGMSVEFDFNYSDLFEGVMKPGRVGREIHTSFAVINQITFAPETFLLNIWLIKTKDGYVPNAGITKLSSNFQHYLKANRFDLPRRPAIMENE